MLLTVHKPDTPINVQFLSKVLTQAKTRFLDTKEGGKRGTRIFVNFSVGSGFGRSYKL